MARIYLLLVLLLLSSMASATDNPTDPVVHARAWLLIDHNSGRRLAERNSNQQFTPADFNKLMVAFVTFGTVKSEELTMDTNIPISLKATHISGPRMFASATSHIPVDNLIKAMIIGGANDATIALAEHIGSDEQAFVSIMNNEAERLGLLNTRFRDSTGIKRSRQFTDADDLATLAKALISRYPKYYHWFQQRDFTYEGLKLYNRNALLWRDQDVDGLMAVRSKRDGYHLIVSGKRDNMRLTAIVLGATSERAVLAAGSELLKFGFDNYETRKLYSGNKGAVNLRVWLGDADVLPVGFRNDLYITLRRGAFDTLQAKLNITGTPFAPISLGKPMGTLHLVVNGEPLSEHELVSLKPIETGGLFSRALDRAEMWLRNIPDNAQQEQTIKN